jgi:asparagine synthetase B (glutamine-hydrolysing)
MCGIFAVHGLQNPAADRSKFIALSKKQRHRGPDWSGCYVGQCTVFVHERLAIVGVGELYFASGVVSIDFFFFRYRRAATF